MTEILQKYMGTGLMIIWFLFALIYLFFQEKRKPMRILFLYTPTIILLLFFNPLFYRLFSSTVGTEIYFRLCWLLPVTVVISYTIVHIFDTLPNAKQQSSHSAASIYSPKVCFASIAIIILIISGKPVYSNPLYSPAENFYHVPQAVVDICDAIKIDGREVMAAFPDEFLLYVRQYSPVVCMPYGREAYTGFYNELNTMVMSNEINVERLSVLSKEALCHYVILKEGKSFIGNMSDYGYQLFDTLHGYEIYKDTTMNY